MVLPARTTMPVPVAFAGELPQDRDLLFEPKCSLQLGHAGGVYAHVVDASFYEVHVRNDTDQDVIIPRRARLGMLGEYDQDGCFPIGAHHADLAATGWRNWKTKLAREVVTAATAMTAAIAMPASQAVTTAMKAAVVLGCQFGLEKTSANPLAVAETQAGSSAVTIDPALENVMANGVTVYGKPEAANLIADLIDDY